MQATASSSTGSRRVWRGNRHCVRHERQLRPAGRPRRPGQNPLRAKAAVACGADLVVELPTTVSLSSAEGFAAGGVGILSKLCDALCFGAETGEAELLMETARALLSAGLFSPAPPGTGRRQILPRRPRRGSRADRAVREILRRPNDILAVEYCKAILVQRSPPWFPFPSGGRGCYHDRTPDRENPSATAVRRLMLEGGAWGSFVPEPARAIFENAPLHSLAAGERAVLARLRTMTDREFEACPSAGRGCGANSCTPAAGKPHWRTSSPVSNPSATPAPALTG